MLFDLARTLIGLVPLLGLGLMVLIWFTTRRVTAPPPNVALPTADAWQAQVSLPSSTFVRNGLGTIRVAGGHLSFQPDDTGEPSWRVPVDTLRAGKNSLLERQEVWVEAPGWSRIEMTVSRERINQWMGNDLKALRERRYADQFLWRLGGSGATIVQGP